MNISGKILFYTLTTAFLTFVIGIGLLGIESREQSYSDAKEIIDARAREFAHMALAEIQNDISIARTLTKTIDAIKDFPYEQRTEMQNLMLKKILEENPDILSAWISWELNFVTPRYKKNFGRRKFQFDRKGVETDYTIRDLDLRGDDPQSPYYHAKLAKRELITNPITYIHNKEDSLLKTQIMLPILQGYRFVGLVGIDVSLERYHALVSKLRPYPDSKAVLLAHNANVIAGLKGNYLNKNIEKVFPSISQHINFGKAVQEAKAFSLEGIENNQEYYLSFSPVPIGTGESPWVFGIAVPTKVIQEKAEERIVKALAIGVLGLGVLALVIGFIATYLSRPLKEMVRRLKLLEKGEFHTKNKLNIRSSDEIGEVARSVDKLIEALHRTSRFANDIGQGRLDTQYELLSEEDTLGKALGDMRENLIKARQEEEQRKDQEKQQAWVQKGVADSGMMLRQRTEDFEEFGYNIISFLVKYIDANQGGFFIVDDLDENDVHIKLTAAYAYDKRRMRQKRMNINEGVIGRAVQEKETIYMTNVPKGYFKITSGFGETLPTSLIVIPLAFENEVFGIVEIASFNELEPYQIQFLEQVCERVAAFLANLKKSIKTNMLLKASQRQGAELSAKEKQYRSQFEELHNEHISLEEKLAQSKELVEAANTLLGIAYLNHEGVFLEANDKYLDLYFISEQALIGSNLANISTQAIENPTQFDSFWRNMQKGAQLKRLERIVREDATFWMEEFYIPVFTEGNRFEKIICFSWDITEYMTKQSYLFNSYQQLKAKLEKRN